MLNGVLEWQEKQTEWYAVHNNNNYCHYSRNFGANGCIQKLNMNSTYSNSTIKPVKCTINESNISRRINLKHKSQNVNLTTTVNGDISRTNCHRDILEQSKSTKTTLSSVVRCKEKLEIKKKVQVCD